MNKPNQLTRVCSTCGKQKPLTAFLQLSGNQGTSYGTVCADCHRTVITPESAAKQEDTSTTSSSRIGAKERVFIEQGRQRTAQNTKATENKEAKKKKHLNNEKEEQLELKSKTALDHRKFYLDPKKVAFLADTKIPPTNTAGQKEQREKASTSTFNEKKIASDTQKREGDIDAHLNLTTVDLSIPFLDSRADIRYNSGFLEQFKEWTGSVSLQAKDNALKAISEVYKNPALATQTTFQEKNFQQTKAQDFLKATSLKANQLRANNLKTVNQLYKNPASTPQTIANEQALSKANLQKAYALKTTNQLYKNPNAATQKDKDPLIDFIDKAWNPSSSKRR